MVKLLIIRHPTDRDAIAFRISKRTSALHSKRELIESSGLMWPSFLPFTLLGQKFSHEKLEEVRNRRVQHHSRFEHNDGVAKDLASLSPATVESSSNSAKARCNSSYKC